MLTKFDIRREREDALHKKITKTISCLRKIRAPKDRLKFLKCISKRSRIITNLAIYLAGKLLSLQQVKGRTLLEVNRNAAQYRPTFAAMEKI